MVDEKVNKMNKWLAWSGWAGVALTLTFTLGSKAVDTVNFVSKTKETNNELPFVKAEIQKTNNKIDGLFAFIKKKFETDSIVKFAEKEAELKYKKELQKSVKSCVPY